MRSIVRRSVLSIVAGIGLSATAWVSHEFFLAAQARQEQHFRRDAHEHAQRIASAFETPLTHFDGLQRMFRSVGVVEKPAFERFVEPVVGQAGILAFGWAPRVEAPQRPDFELQARRLWGAEYAVSEFVDAARRVTAPQRERYYPVLFSDVSPHRPSLLGIDLFAPQGRRGLVSHAIDSGAAVSSGVVASYLNPEINGKTAIFVAPIYRGGDVPPNRDARQAEVHGVLVALFDVDRLFKDGNRRPEPSPLRVALLEKPDAAQAIVRWEPPSPGSPLPFWWRMPETRYVFDLPGWGWSLNIEPTPAWLRANAPDFSKVVLTAVIGLLLTGLLLIGLRRLLMRSYQADVLAITHAESLENQRRVEDLASKLLQAIDQNPATVYITDAEGRFEYVNDEFLIATGYQRDEVLGQSMDVLRPENDEAASRAMWACAARGESWQGELQTRRRDGSLFWERVVFSPLKDRDGRLTNFVAIKEDVTELREVMTRLQESEQRFRAATSAMVEGLAVIGPDGRFLFANRAAEAFMGSPAEGLPGLRPEDIALERLLGDGSTCPPEDYPEVYSLREGRELRNEVFGLRYPDGAERWIEINSSRLAMAGGGEHGLVVTLSDITERRLVEAQLRLAFEAIRQSGEGILITDADHRILSVNPAFEAKTGYAVMEVTGQTPAVLASMRSDTEFYGAMQAGIERDGHWQGEVWNQRKDGEAYPEWLNVSMVSERDGLQRHYVYIYSDMSERVEAEQRIELLEYHDPLTGLPNRVLLRDRVEQATAQAGRLQSRVALMFLDLDRFKTINDSLGHPVGDQLLTEVVTRLKRCVRESDTISRLGGDEFVIVLHDVRDSEAVSRVAEKIHQQMQMPADIDGHSLVTSFSIGVAICPDDGQDFDTLLKRAETAMYQAKDSGRNSHRFFTEQMNQRVVEHLTLETQLRRALENQEFVLHYQPQMDLHDGSIVGVEALIRWNSPESGLVSPARFIPVAEESGLIVPIGAWVLREACRQAREWQDAGIPPLVMAVNLSAVQFHHHDMVNSVINALVLSDLESQWLELELTESILIQDAEAAMESIRHLKALGIQLSLDDFGTGYSSLTYLKRFSVDKLKIDQSFVRDLVSDPEDAAIVRAIIQMAHSLRLRTVAEGVENEDLANLLRVFHCDEVQGYWFARPMPPRELEDFLRAHPARQAAGVQGTLL